MTEDSTTTVSFSPTVTGVAMSTEARPAVDALLVGLAGRHVMVVESFERGQPWQLLPEEAAVVANARPARQAEFAAVRGCARAALARLGVAPTAILPDGSGPMWAARAPRWPAAVVGSMTHVAGYAGAAVALAAQVASVGIDAETNAPLPDGLRDFVTLPEERAQLDRLGPAGDGVAWDRLLFSAKEAVYKAWFPLTGRWLGFDGCRIDLDPAGSFQAQLVGDFLTVDGRQLDRLDGRWRRASAGGAELLATVVTIPRTGAVYDW